MASTEVEGTVVESEVRELLVKRGRLCIGEPDFSRVILAAVLRTMCWESQAGARKPVRRRL